MFITVRETPITVGENTVFIKSRMDLATAANVNKAFQQIVLTGGVTTNQAVTLPEKLVLLENNVMKWEGPDFEGFPCSVVNIRKIDPMLIDVEGGLWDTVLQEISDRNTPRTEPTPEEWPDKNGEVKKKAHAKPT